MPPGTVFALYAGLYSLGRLWIETIRIDHTDHVYGQRVEFWVAARRGASLPGRCSPASGAGARRSA